MTSVAKKTGPDPLPLCWVSGLIPVARGLTPVFVQRRRLSRCLTMIAALCVLLAGGSQFVPAAEPSSDAATTALRKQGFPWYDEKNDQFRPMTPVLQPEHEQTRWQTETPKSDGKLFLTLQMILMWTILIAILAIVATIALRTMQDAMQDSVSPRATATVALETLEALPEPVRKVNDLLGEATRQASLSAFESAMIFYYSWQLLQLDRHQYIELQKGKTNRQYMREVAVSVPELRDLFSPSTRLFEDAFFGQLPISRDAFLQVWEQRSQFEFTTRSHRP